MGEENRLVVTVVDLVWLPSPRQQQPNLRQGGEVGWLLQAGGKLCAGGVLFIPEGATLGSQLQ